LNVFLSYEHTNVI